jgi:hypothetical protein
MNILVPIPVTSAMVTTAIAEPHASETAWVSGGTYAVDNKRIVVALHREFICIAPVTGSAVSPENDPAHWEDYGPTVRMAPFDTYVSSAAYATSTLSYGVSIGFFNAISLYGLAGTQLTVATTNGPGGANLEAPRVISLYAESLGLFEYLFGPKNPKSKLVLTDFPTHPSAYVTVTITGPAAVSLGMFNLGYYRSVVTSIGKGGTQYGSSIEPTTTSRIETDAKTGRVKIKKGNATTGMRANVSLCLADANYALSTLQATLDVPVTWVGSAAIGYEGLNVFGLGVSSLLYNGPDNVMLSVNVKGMI